MRFMVIVKASKNSEAGVLPSTELLTEMGKYNEDLTKAGVMLAGEGLQPSSKGARVRFSEDQRIVIDGPFAETKELVCPPDKHCRGSIMGRSLAGHTAQPRWSSSR